MSNETAARQDLLIAKCVEVASTVLTDQEAIIQIRRCEPTFGRNYTNHYKVYLATLDPSGLNPINQRCVVVSITSNMDSAKVEPSLSCDSVKDLD
ncbi:hypothetical protein [Microseira wollei]|uniref:Uncharacterized protein n=1 Tax=Microseira wollei NIES-4236 TaxID=2530354 RepID=A0AAV3XU78_9CYAN|nr:hypothetical protein [Microseira wollei]GET43902.1 hypothetical protein MiSe_87280 [Microseira wollei NIES-4236]